jgi:hypothetical protein
MIIIYLRGVWKDSDREKKELQATLCRYVSVIETQNSAREQEVTNLRKHICFIEGKLKVSENEFNGAKFNWKLIEWALHGKINDMKERISNLEETKRLLEEISKKPVSTFSVQLRNATRSPTVLVELEGIQRSFLIDTGATISLIKSGISRVKIAATNTTVRGLADQIFPLQGTQLIQFRMGGKVFEHNFYVGVPGGGEDGILGIDFLAGHEALVDIANHKLGLPLL